MISSIKIKIAKVMEIQSTVRKTLIECQAQSDKKKKMLPTIESNVLLMKPFFCYFFIYIFYAPSINLDIALLTMT